MVLGLGDRETVEDAQARRAALGLERAGRDEVEPRLVAGDLAPAVGGDLLAHAQQHEPVALDVDAVLLGELARRVDALPVETVVADAADFDLGRTFALVLAPMQTVQLLPGAAARASMLAAIRRHLEPGGIFAAALANALDTFGEIEAPVPDMRDVGGVVYASRPTAVRDDGDGFVLERVRERVSPRGERVVSEDRTRLTRLTPAALAAEGRAAGLRPLPGRCVPETDDHVGSEVVVLGA